MKKWIPALAVLLGASAGLSSPNDKLSCANEFQQSFDGATLPSGKLDMKPTAENEPVALALVRPRDHGYRCGRGAIDGVPLAINAQFVFGTTAFTFQG